MADPGKPDSKLPPLLEGFGKSGSEREAAISDFGKQFGDIELGALDDEGDPLELARKASGKPAKPAASKPVAAKPHAAAKPAHSFAQVDKPNLEPVSDDAHKHRRLPTQPPSALALALDEGPTHASPSAAGPSTSGTLPPPPKLGPRHSPAPIRSGLISTDRITNMLGCVAIALAVMIIPAKQFANKHEVAEVEPLIADLEGAIDHPLGVEAGLVTKPEVIAAQIREGTGKTRRRYAMIWLLLGLPIGLGLSYIPRP